MQSYQAERRIFDILAAKGFSWAPECHGAMRAFDNAIGRPFVVLAWVKGSQLAWDENSPERPVGDRVSKQLAAIQLCLVECTLEAGMCERGGDIHNPLLMDPCGGFFDWDGHLHETRDSHTDFVWRRACFLGTGSPGSAGAFVNSLSHRRQQHRI